MNFASRSDHLTTPPAPSPRGTSLSPRANQTNPSLDGSHTETNGSHDTNNNSHVDPDRPVYINKQWLWEWKSLASVGPINNADIMCSHGQIRIEFKKGIENWYVSSYPVRPSL